MISLLGTPDVGTTSANAYKSGPRQGSSSAPSLTELRNPTLVSSKISIDTNVTTSLPIMIRPWLDGYEKSFRQGSILFTYCGDNKVTRLETVADIPTLNFLLEECHNNQAPQNRTGIFSDLKSTELTLEHKMNLYGVLRNDMLADSALQKLLNVDVFGRSMVANIWGRVLRGDHVGLAVVKRKRKDMPQAFLSPDGAMLPAAVIDEPTDGIRQIEPTINGELVYSDNGKRDYELYLPLGVVVHAVAKLPSRSHRKQALRSQNHYSLLPRIEILLI